MSRSLKSLHPEVRRRVQLLLSWADYYGLQPVITSTRRSTTQQRRLYARYLAGRHPLPVAPPGTSDHEWGGAVDIVATRKRGMLDFGLSEAQKDLGSLASYAGLRWAGAADPVHFSVA